MTLLNPTTVFHSIVVQAPVQRAYDVFVSRFGDFKPRTHNMLAVPIAETVLEPYVGGHIYDRGIDGTECRWARILELDPPTRLVFSWDISPSWQVESDLDRTSRVTVTFTADGADRTRVELTHDQLDRHGDGSAGMAAGVDGPNGWPIYLSGFAGLAASMGAPLDEVGETGSRVVP